MAASPRATGRTRRRCSRYGHRQAVGQSGSRAGSRRNKARRSERISPDGRIYASAVVVVPIMNARLRHFNLISDYAQDNPGSEPRIKSLLKIRPPVCSYIAKYSLSKFQFIVARCLLQKFRVNPAITTNGNSCR